MIRDKEAPVPVIPCRVIRAPEPVAFEPFGLIVIAGAGVEGVLHGVVGHRAHVSAAERIVGVAQQRALGASARGAIVARVGALRRMGQVAGAIKALHRDLLARLEIVRADVELRACGEDHVSTLQYAAKRDVVSVGEGETVRPGVAVVFGQQDPARRMGEGLIVELRIYVDPLGLGPVPEMISLSDRCLWHG